MEILTNQNSGFGPIFRDTFGLCMNRGGATALVIGDLMAVDVLGADGDSTSGTQSGTGTYNYGNLINPATALLGGAASLIDPGAWYGIVVDLCGGAGADNKMVKVQWQGVVKVAKVDNSAILEGSPLMPSDGARTLVLATAAAIGRRVLARASAANSSTAGTMEVVFDGINGLGQVGFVS